MNKQNSLYKEKSDTFTNMFVTSEWIKTKESIYNNMFLSKKWEGFEQFCPKVIAIYNIKATKK